MKKTFMFDMNTDDFPVSLDVIEMIGVDMSKAQELIRCKDCKFVGTDATCCHVCNREGMGLRPFHVYDDDYCSYAERKEE